MGLWAGPDGRSGPALDVQLVDEHRDRRRRQRRRTRRADAAHAATGGTPRSNSSSTPSSRSKARSKRSRPKPDFRQVTAAAGRIMPLAKPHLREIARSPRAGCDAQLAGRRTGSSSGTCATSCRPDGSVPRRRLADVVFDTLGGRLSPRPDAGGSACGYLRAIAERADRRGGGTFEHIHPGQRTRRTSTTAARNRLRPLHTCRRRRQRFRSLDAAVGDLYRWTERHRRQRARRRCFWPMSIRNLPVIFTDGALYRRRMTTGIVAVGSTSENKYADPPCSTDELLDELLVRAEALVPLLARCGGGRALGRHPAEICTGREPIVGRHPDHRKPVGPDRRFQGELRHRPPPRGASSIDEITRPAVDRHFRHPSC